MKKLIIPFIRAADEAAPARAAGHLVPDEQGAARNVLVTPRTPQEVIRQLSLSLPSGEGHGKAGLLDTIRAILENSVNTWDQGFLDKLYASTNAVGESSTSPARFEVSSNSSNEIRLA